MASVYDDEVPWWVKALGEEWKKILGSGAEVLEDVKEGAGDIKGAISDTEKERAERAQRKIDKRRAEEKVIADLTPGPADPGIWGGEYKPTDEYGRVLQGPFGQQPLAPRQAQVVDKKTPLEEKEDYMNQLLMSALMAGGKRTTGRQAPSSYGVGAQVPFGDPWVMRRPWEQDYRYLK